MEQFIEAIPDLSQWLEGPALSPENQQTDPVSDLSADTCTFLTLAMIQDPYLGATGGQRSLSEEEGEGEVRSAPRAASEPPLADLGTVCE